MKGKEPKVSVIIPVYNSEKYLERCLDSVVEQTYKNIEIVVVDNASEGNVVEIFNDYRELYPKRTWKLVSHKVNQGLFKARVSGVEQSSGDYIAFIDSDDRVSCDFYRILVDKALSGKYDMVASEVIYEMEDGTFRKSFLALQEMFPSDIPSDDLLSLFYKCEGKCHSWHTVWNKIYSRQLWKIAYPYIKKIDKHIVMCEDYLFTTIFYAFARKYSIVHNVWYYYFKGSDAYTSQKASVEKIEKNLADVGSVFKASKDFLVSINRFDELKGYHKRFSERYYRIWRTNINSFDLTGIKRRKMIALLDKSLPVSEKVRLNYQVNEEDTYSTSLSVPVENHLEYVKKAILDNKVKYVSFDIFDTLVLRPFLHPEDLFELLNVEFYKHTFSKGNSFAEMRMASERAAREKQQIHHGGYQDITLDEIYDEMVATYGIQVELAEHMKRAEVGMELELARPRKTGYDLFCLAQYTGKTIILMSDMYLPEADVRKLLNKCGYPEKIRLFLSSELRLTKNTGDLYGYVKKSLGVPSGAGILHIGDNLYSDVTMAEKNGFKAIHLPRPADVFMGQAPSLHRGSFYREVFKPNLSSQADSALTFLSLRCMLAMIANKFFDNPYVQYIYDSDFSASPYMIGYSTLGMYIYSLVIWLKNSTENYDKIHFIARDGYLVKKVFNKLYPEKDTDYLYVSRKALVPLMIEAPSDFTDLSSIISLDGATPNGIISLISPILPEKFDFGNFCKENRISPNTSFRSKDDYFKFLLLLQQECYDADCIETYRNDMRDYFRPKFGGSDATFDVGYSGRTEKILGTLLGTRIDAFYVHINDATALVNALKYKFSISCFYSRTPLVAGAVRELLMSEIAPSCVGYQKDADGGICPKFEKRSTNCQKEIILQIFHDGAMDFIDDFTSTFSKYIDSMPFRGQDAAMPFEFLLSKSSIYDRWIFKVFDFEDDLFIGKKVSVFDFWNIQTANKSSETASVYLPDISYLPIWKKAIILALLDRKVLKDKAKAKLSGKPILYHTAKFGYGILRKIYHGVIWLVHGSR